MVFLCSPGNPTGKLLAMDDIKVIVSAASNSIIVVDEAYIDFASSSDCSAARLLADFDNVVVLQTLSKSFGLAGIRLGMALAKPQLIRYFYLVKPPYNISTLTSFVALQAFSNRSLSNMKSLVCNINTDKQRLAKSILDWPGVKSIRGGLDANFLLVELESNQQALAIYKALASSEKDRIVLRFRGNDLNCSGCIRITVGTTDEMELLEQRWNAAFDSLHDKQQQ